MPALLAVVTNLASCIYVPRAQLFSIARNAPSGAIAVELLDQVLTLLEAVGVHLHANALVPSPRAAELIPLLRAAAQCAPGPLMRATPAAPPAASPAQISPVPRAPELASTQARLQAPPAAQTSGTTTAQAGASRAAAEAAAARALAETDAALQAANLSGEANVPAKERGWGEMSAAEHAAAMCLGYDGESWDEGEVPPTCELPWDDLGPREQRAALLLGYNRDEWEKERLEEEEEEEEA